MERVCILEVRHKKRNGRGRYWRPNGQGYTDQIARAGVYLMSEESAHVTGTSDHSIAVDLEPKLTELRDAIDALESQTPCTTYGGK